MVLVGTIAIIFYPEAPRYLVKSGRIDEAVATIQRIASINGVESNSFEKASIESALAMD